MKQQHISAIQTLIQTINSSWQNKQFEGLADCFHPDVVIVGPDHKEIARGKTACVESYREFSENAIVHEFSLSEPVINVWDDTAVSVNTWSMTYQRGKEIASESGVDQYVLLFDGRLWQVVWRAVLLTADKLA